MTDILKKVRPIVAKYEEAKKEREKAEAKERRQQENIWEEERAAKAAAETAEQKAESRASKKLAATDKKLDKAFVKLAEAFRDGVSYKRKETKEGIVYKFDGHRNVPDMHIGLRPAFNGKSGVEKRFTGLECWGERPDAPKETKRESTPRVGDMHTVYGSKSDEVCGYEWYENTYRAREVYSPPTDQAVTTWLSEWFADVIKANEELRKALKAGKISADVQTGLPDSIKSRKYDEWVLDHSQRQYEETAAGARERMDYDPSS